MLRLAALLPFLLAASIHAAETAKPPNIVFILADDLGIGDVGCYGQKRIKTPNIDRLAAEGMKFTDFYAGSTVCAPSRCVLMTGLHTGHCYIRGNAKLNLRPSDVTVAEVLHKAGYTNGLCGKWGLGHEGSQGVPTRQGFDYFFGYLDQHHAHNYYPAFLMRNEDRVPLGNVVPGNGEFGSGVATKKVQYSAELIGSEALEFIRKNAEDRFFLYFASTLPHANNEANRVSRHAAMEIPDYGQYADKDWPDAEKGLAAMVSYLDRDVGRILDLLDELGIDDETIVFFSSDNGPHSEGSRPEFFDSNGPFRGIKRDLYDGGVHVPFLARWPGKIKPGSTSDHVGYFADFLPTAAELAGVKLSVKTDGLSIVPTLLGHADRQQQHDYIYWEFYEGKNGRAVRMGPWKGIEKPFGSDHIELYNVTKDPGETTDVAASHPEVVAKDRAAIKEAHVPSPEWRVRGAGGRSK
jgi:arylsulfatase A-like enzyme